MMMLKLAWRNIWRNRRRSLIILTSIIVGVVAIVFIDSLDRGFLKQMFDNQLGAHTSHLQVHKRGFNDNKIVQNFMVEYKTVVSAIESNANVKNYSKRVIAFGLLSSASNSSGVSLVGIEPNAEEKITTIKQSIVEGRYLSGSKHEIVISKKLAETLDVGLGDRVVAMASALDGTIGSDVFRVVGLYQSPSSDFDKIYIYIPLGNAQELLRVGNEISEIAVIAYQVDSVGQIKNHLLAVLGTPYEVLSYQELLPLIVMSMELMEQILFVFYVIIGLAMVFGIANTMLMSVFERIYEFGVLKATGLQDSKLFVMIVLEASLLGLLGTSVGAAIGLAINVPLTYSGLNFAAFSEGLASFGTGAIVYPVLNYSGVASAILVVFATCCIAAVYPAYRAVKLEPMSAMRFI